ncbi:hypothetical protein ElyMa_006135200 [Elysia marginata]|uniref:Uncharacterized protein n=1 Tax=Elysia marginata TaxID=1093978 RepID=A0AAV4GWN8_9GAST|nr:hypothetical protein ElyMa_006135200 [Elysia marginata]
MDKSTLEFVLLGVRTISTELSSSTSRVCEEVGCQRSPSFSFHRCLSHLTHSHDGLSQRISRPRLWSAFSSSVQAYPPLYCILNSPNFHFRERGIIICVWSCLPLQTCCIFDTPHAIEVDVDAVVIPPASVVGHGTTST